MESISDWSVAVFAYNVADTVTQCLDSVVENSAGKNVSIYVLANGCTDTTEQRVAEYCFSHKEIHLIKLDLRDKANAWNAYVHEVAPAADIHFFVDGDTVVGPRALARLSDTLQQHSEANAAGALPATGRDRSGWSQRMVAFGYFAGGLYALRGAFLDQLRQQQIKLPVGLIGEDFLLSSIAKGQPSSSGMFKPSPELVIQPDARFSFRSLSVTRASDWWTYLRRLIRYRMRSHQLSMLLARTSQAGFDAMPKHIEDLYGEVDTLPRYYWRGRTTPFDIIAVWLIRRRAKIIRALQKRSA